MIIVIRCPYACDVEQGIETRYEYDDDGKAKKQSKK